MESAAVPEVGIDENRFESPVSENFKCSICLNVLNDPKSCQNNQHYFCHGCISQHLEHFHTCPECMEELTPETLGTPPRVLLNCISELIIKCDHVGQGCPERVQLGRLKSHLKECGFAPTMCTNDGCTMQINRRDRIHHETELCEFRRVQCHDCAELRKEVFKLGERQDEMSKGQAKLEGKIDQLSKSQSKLEGKIDQVTTRLQNFERNIMTNVNEQYLSNQRENVIVVQEIIKIKGFMNDVLLKLNSIDSVVCQRQEARDEMLQDNETGLKTDSESKANSPESAATKEVAHTPLRLERNTGNNNVHHIQITPGSVECQSFSKSVKSEQQIKDANLQAVRTVGSGFTRSQLDEKYAQKSEQVKSTRPGYDDDTTSKTSHYRKWPGRSLSSDAISSRDCTDTFRSPSRTNRNEGGTPFAPNTPQEIDIGMTVLITRNIGKLDKAIVRYIGTLPGQGNNVFVGLELSRPDGKHDGKFSGERFFQCKPNHGIFVSFDKVVMAYTR